MLARGTSGAPDGLAFFRPVLSGVLYRAGFSGGDKARTGSQQLRSAARSATTVSRGRSTPISARTRNYGATSCGAGGLDYEVRSLLAARGGDEGDPRRDQEPRRRPGARPLHVGRPFLGRAVGDGACPVLRLVRGAREGLLERGAQWRPLLGRMRRLDRRRSSKASRPIPRSRSRTPSAPRSARSDRAETPNMQPTLPSCSRRLVLAPLAALASDAVQGTETTLHQPERRGRALRPDRPDPGRRLFARTISRTKKPTARSTSTRRPSRSARRPGARAPA